MKIVRFSFLYMNLGLTVYKWNKQTQSNASFGGITDYVIMKELYLQYPLQLHSSTFICFSEEPDPLLLTGRAAKLAVMYLYSKELFYEDIPHVKAVLNNQRQRHANGLKGNTLGSLRPVSPFHRFGNGNTFLG